MSANAAARPVLVAIDFSPHSEAALLAAMEQAEALVAPLSILHVIHDPGDAPGYYRVKGSKKHMGRLEDVARQLFDQFIDKMAERHPRCSALKRADRMLIAGLPVHRILEVADKIGARMIVVGSQGRSGLPRLLLGAKAEQVVRLSPVPVLVAKAVRRGGSKGGQKQ